LLAVLLACVGVYGLLSYDVACRTHEIGIRMALGAEPRAVLSLVARQAVALALAGTAVGVLAALAATRYIRALLYGVHPCDPLILTAVATLLLLVVLVACCLPARRATTVDPMVALRHE